MRKPKKPKKRAMYSADSDRIRELDPRRRDQDWRVTVNPHGGESEQMRADRFRELAAMDKKEPTPEFLKRGTHRRNVDDHKGNI